MLREPKSREKGRGNEDIPAEQLQMKSTQVMEMLQFLGQESIGNSNHTTLPATINYEVFTTGDQILQRYLPDGYNSQLGNVQDMIEVTTEDGE